MFKWVFLLDPLKIIPNKEIKIEFNGSYGPVVINETSISIFFAY